MYEEASLAVDGADPCNNSVR